MNGKTKLPLFSSPIFLDKQSFFELYSTFVYLCPGTNQYIWKDQICDGRSDCPSHSDEADCLTCKCTLLDF